VSETFDASWLDLRESVDHRSRAAELLDPLREWWTAGRGASILDLGCGTGSNLRYLAAELPGRQEWTLVDHDEELLGRIEPPSPRVAVRPLHGDLAGTGLDAVGGARLVTASALLDLVSEAWLDALVAACADAGSAALLALSYDGSVAWPAPEDPLDEVVRDAVNEHQRRDKGLGPALGPAAGRVAEALFRSRGYRTRLAPSPWRLGPDAAALAGALIAGWERAAAEQRPERSAEIRRWAERRVAGLGRPGVALVVGHVDLLALPPRAADGST
jgi:SAM-dependent methyltransferase